MSRKEQESVAEVDVYLMSIHTYSFCSRLLVNMCKNIRNIS